MTIKSYHLAALTLRYGLGFVFLWFGFSQLHNPSAWVGFLPAWTTSIGISQTGFVILNAFFEIVSAALLLVGLYTRPVSFLLALHMFGIAFTIGMTAVGIRDIGIAFATLGLGFLGAGVWSIDGMNSQQG